MTLTIETRYRWVVGLALLATLVISGCGMSNNDADEPTTEARYFESPQAAVPIIAGLLRKEAFATLAQYYDLAGSGIDRKQLESGAFFIRRERPAVAHPAGFWRYRQPFAPGFRFHSMAPDEVTHVYVVTVMIEIEQGNGPDQVGFDTFRMIKSAKGWQLLPDPDEDISGKSM